MNGNKIQQITIQSNTILDKNAYEDLINRMTRTINEIFRVQLRDTGKLPEALLLSDVKDADGNIINDPNIKKVSVKLIIE